MENQLQVSHVYGAKRVLVKARELHSVISPTCICRSVETQWPLSCPDRSLARAKRPNSPSLDRSISRLQIFFDDGVQARVIRNRVRSVKLCSTITGGKTRARPIAQMIQTRSSL